MNTLTRLLAALSLSVVGITACLAVASRDPDYPLSLCQEVDIELAQAVEEGILVEEDATAISDRCRARFPTND